MVGSRVAVEDSGEISKILSHFIGRHQDFTIVPFHTHLLDDLSSGDIRSFERNVRYYGVHYMGLGTPTTFRAFRGFVDANRSRYRQIIYGEAVIGSRLFYKSNMVARELGVLGNRLHSL